MIKQFDDLIIKIKIKTLKLPILLTLIILCTIRAANAKPTNCISIFEKLIKTSSFRPEATSRKKLKIDLYDISVNDDSIFFKIFDSDIEQNKIEGYWLY